jgi:biotin operon repressor
MKESKEKKDLFMQKVVLSCIPRGIDNAIHSKELSFMTGLSKRDIRIIIQKLRKDGEPICSLTNKGYWIAKNSDELYKCLSSLREQRDTLEDTIEALMKTYSQF